MLVLLSWPLAAMYAMPDLEKVPVDRLVTNLEQMVAADPTNVQLRINLARVHAMAFALKTDTATVWKGKEQWGAWFGNEPRPIPFSAQGTTDSGKLAAARVHLEKAIARYKEVIELQPNHLIARLGYAWCVEQSGDKMAAIGLYRALVDLAWASEKDLTSAGLGWYSITAETARYLIPLLDSTRDREEIATLLERSRQMQRVQRPITPIVVPLRDGLDVSDLVDERARVSFDADGSGVAKPWTWITRDVGWLVFDHRNTRQVTSALQMFGSVTFWLFWDTGYDALRALDDNGDGTIAGPELDGFALWHDINTNGVSEPGEVTPLVDWGVVSLSCTFRRDERHPEEIAFSPAGVTFRDGTVRPTYDVVLHPRTK